MKCPKCGGDMELYVSVRLKLPAQYALNVTKENIAKKSCVIMAADWERARVTCKCGFSMKGI